MESTLNLEPKNFGFALTLGYPRTRPKNDVIRNLVTEGLEKNLAIALNLGLEITEQRKRKRKKESFLTFEFRGYVYKSCLL